MKPRVRLLDDGGATAAGSDFFRSSAFLRIENASHSLVLETTDTRLALPLIVREIENGQGFDAFSPYGYPGGALIGGPLDPDEIDFSSTGLVSLFLRDRISDPVLHGGTKRSKVFLHDPKGERYTNRTFSYHVRRNERRGYIVELVHGHDVDDDTLKDFVVAYRQTMQRVGASERYYFSSEYIRGCLYHAESWMTITRSPDGSLAAATISVASDGFLHYYLGATSDDHRGTSPVKNSFVRMLDLADQLGLPLNLGGGLTPDDGLERFKRGFSNSEENFITHEIICDPEAYRALSRGHIRSDFFPAYRAP